jgi:dihydrofolate reductase
MTTPVVAAIVAMDETRVIGKDGALPWHLPEDLAHFKKLTTGHLVIMGRKTWDSLPPKFRPLPNRVNLVVSRTPEALALPEGVLTANSLDAAIAMATERADNTQRVWIIGGAELYKTGLPRCYEVHLTLVRGVHDGDARFPEFETDFDLISEGPGQACAFRVYRRRGS